MFFSQKYCLQYLIWPKQSPAAVTHISVFSMLLQALLGHFFFCVCTVYPIWEKVLQHHRCLHIFAQEQQAACSKRSTQGFRKEQFSACEDAHIATWKLCRS